MLAGGLELLELDVMEPFLRMKSAAIYLYIPPQVFDELCYSP